MVSGSTAVVAISDLASCLIAFCHADLWQNFGEILVVARCVTCPFGLRKALKMCGKSIEKA
jgi:hypothetical protein